VMVGCWNLSVEFEGLWAVVIADRNVEQDKLLALSNS
jgi:hypothetical protein